MSVAETPQDTVPRSGESTSQRTKINFAMPSHGTPNSDGQLQHPGIAPTHELGQFSDRRPFFSMKLVKGQTLPKLLFQSLGSHDS